MSFEQAAAPPTRADRLRARLAVTTPGGSSQVRYATTVDSLRSFTPTSGSWILEERDPSGAWVTVEEHRSAR